MTQIKLAKCYAFQEQIYHAPHLVQIFKICLKNRGVQFSTDFQNMLEE